MAFILTKTVQGLLLLFVPFFKIQNGAIETATLRSWTACAEPYIFDDWHCDIFKVFKTRVDGISRNMRRDILLDGDCPQLFSANVQVTIDYRSDDTESAFKSIVAFGWKQWMPLFLRCSYSIFRRTLWYNGYLLKPRSIPSLSSRLFFLLAFLKFTTWPFQNNLEGLSLMWTIEARLPAAMLFAPHLTRVTPFFLDANADIFRNIFQASRQHIKRTGDSLKILFTNKATVVEKKLSEAKSRSGGWNCSHQWTQRLYIGRIWNGSTMLCSWDTLPALWWHVLRFVRYTGDGR